MRVIELYAGSVIPRRDDASALFRETFSRNRNVHQAFREGGFPKQQERFFDFAQDMLCDRARSTILFWQATQDR